MGCALPFQALSIVLLCAPTIGGCVQTQIAASSATPTPAGTHSTNAGSGSCLASLAIVDGATTNQFPSVALLVGMKQGQPLGTCSGTFIASNAFLTASHCVDPQTFDSFVVSMISTWNTANGIPPGVQPASVIAPERFPGDESPFTKPRNLDIAVMIFAQDVAPSVTPVTSMPTAAGATATLVGFGQSSTQADAGNPVLAKRYGSNVTGPETASDVIRFWGPDTDNGANVATNQAGAAPGDSGGPLLVNGVVVGVVSGPDDQRSGQVLDAYADVGGTFGQHVLALARAAGAKIPTPSTTAQGTATGAASSSQSSSPSPPSNQANGNQGQTVQGANSLCKAS